MPLFDDDPRMGGETLDQDLNQTLAAAADLCLPPWRHAVVNTAENPQDPEEITVRLEARDGDGIREPEQDLNLEIYRSGQDLNVMLSWCQPADRPLLWHGRHPVWMDGSSGERCDRPADGMPLEALCRRIRALVISEMR